MILTNKPLRLSRIAVLAVLLLVAGLSQASGATRYVATTGSNSNPGTLAAPWQTLVYAVANLTAGDTLFIRGGTYTGTNNVINSGLHTVPSGSSWDVPVTIAGYAGETATLQTPDGMGSIELTTAVQYIVFRDFVVDGSAVTSLAASAIVYQNGGSHHIRYQRLEVKNGLRNGFQTSCSGGDAHHNEILDSSIHDNGRDTSESNTGYGAYLVTTANLVEGNEIYNNHGYGVHLNGGGCDTSDTIVRGNNIHNNVVRVCPPGPPCTGGTTSYGVMIAFGSDVLVANNVIRDMGVGGPMGSAGGGVLVYNDADAALVYNNTITTNTGECVALQYYASAPIVRNNICFDNDGGDVVDYGGTGTPTISDNLTTDPDFVNAGAHDYHLDVGSDALEAGATLAAVPTDYEGNPRPRGDAYDIGAFEGGVDSGIEEEPPNNRTKQPLLTQTKNGANNTCIDIMGPGNDTWSNWTTCTSTSVVAQWPLGGTLKRMVMHLTAAPGGAASRTFTVQVNGSDTAMTVTFGSADTDKSDLVHTVTIAVGDVVRLRQTVTSSPAATRVEFAAEFDAEELGKSAYTIFPNGTPGSSSNVNPFQFANTVWFGTYTPPKMPAATLTAWRVALATAPGAGTSRTFTWYKNGVAQNGSGGTTDTRITISDSATSGTWTGTFAWSAGDTIAVRSSQSGSPAASRAAISSVLDMDDGDSMFCGYPDLTQPAVNGYPAVAGGPGTGSATTESDITTITTYTSFTVRNFYVTFSGSPGSGKSYTFDFRQNSSSPAGTPTVTIADSSTSGSDTSNSITYSSGQTISIREVPSGTPGQPVHSWCAVAHALSDTVPAAGTVNRRTSDPGGTRTGTRTTQPGQQQ